MTIGPGSLINGKYRLGRQLGEGGMGAIYEARHEFLGTEVALKFLHPALSSRPSVVARFVQEARVSANIRSPHVVQVVDVDQSPEGLAFLVMELLMGEPLSQRLAREPVLALSLSCAIVVQVLLALEAAHGLGVVHRDMKPENVFLTDAPGEAGATTDGLLVKILDFGIAKLRTLGEVQAQLTRPGVVMGTPEYMAPEQVFSSEAVDARADLYGVGAMLFEMIAGRRPVHGDDPRAIAAVVMSGQTPRLDVVAPGTPVPLADLVSIALAPKPNDRFSSAVAMRKALVHACRESHVPLEVPPQPTRARATSIASSKDEVLGGVGLGVAPQAMLGPGNPASIAAYDARNRGELPPSLGISPPARSLARGHDPASIAQDGSGTLAAAPSPYVPPVAQLLAVGEHSTYGSGGTDAGFVPPYGREGGWVPVGVPFPRPGAALGSVTEPYPSEARKADDPEGTPTPTEPASTRSMVGGAALWPWVALGVIAAATIVTVVVVLTRSSTPPATPVPVATARENTEPEDPPPEKKKLRDVPPPASSPSPSVVIPVPPPKSPPPRPHPSAPRPADLPSASPSTTPPVTRPSDVIEIPFPFPLPT